MATVSQITPLQRAQNLQSRVQNLNEYGLPQQDLDDFSWLVSRVLELEGQKQQKLSYQSTWHKETFSNDPQKYEEHKRKNTERVMKNYHENPAYREKILAQQRLRYAAKKNG